jgi:hypothetical protein
MILILMMMMTRMERTFLIFLSRKKTMVPIIMRFPALARRRHATRGRTNGKRHHHHHRDDFVVLFGV